MTPRRNWRASSTEPWQWQTRIGSGEVVYVVLEGLQSHQTGLNGTAIPPPWIIDDDRRERWPVKKSSGAAGDAGEGRPFVFCHIDLSYRNMRIDSTPLEAKWLFDGEFAGSFFPEEFLRIFSPTRTDNGNLFKKDERKKQFINLLE